MDQDATWHDGRPQPRRLCVRWGQAHLPTKGWSPAPQFSAHFYSGQAAGCIKMPLGMEVGLSPRNFLLDGDPAPLPKRRRSPPIFSPCLLWPNGWMDQDGTWHGGRPWSCPHCARWRHSCPPPKRGQSPPIFGPSLLWPNGCMDQDATWYGGRPRPTQHCVRCGPSYPQEKGHTHPYPILAHVYCGQMVGWMKTPLSTAVDLGPGHIVLDGVPASSREEGTAATPSFRHMSIVATVAHLSYC